MGPLKRAFLAALALVVGACTGPSPAPKAPAAGTLEEPPAPPPEVASEPEAPGTVRCGVDDAPVPVGTRDQREILRVNAIQIDTTSTQAQPPTVVRRARFSDAGLSAAGLPDFFSTCDAVADVGDRGEQTVSLALTSAGIVRSARLTKGRLSGYSACLLERLCALPPFVDAKAKSADLSIVTGVDPPAFVGEVSVSVKYPVPSARSPEVSAALSAVQSILRAKTLRCVQREPPSDDFSLFYSVTLAPNQSAIVGGEGGREHAGVIWRCILESLVLPTAQRLRAVVEGAGEIVVSTKASPAHGLGGAEKGARDGLPRR